MITLVMVAFAVGFFTGFVSGSISLYNLYIKKREDMYDNNQCNGQD